MAWRTTRTRRKILISTQVGARAVEEVTHGDDARALVVAIRREARDAGSAHFGGHYFVLAGQACFFVAKPLAMSTRR